MENKCLYIRPNNKGVFDMNLICNIRQIIKEHESHINIYYEITFNNRDSLSITTEEYEDLLTQMTNEYSFYENDIDNHDKEDEYDNEESNEDYDSYAVTSHDVKINDYNEEYEEYSESENKGLFGFCNKIKW